LCHLLSGTGKTTLIEGILSVLLSEIVSEMTENNTFKVSDHNKCGANVTEDVGESKKHILLVAPSNAAVDELVLRLYQHGLIFLTLKENVPPTSHCVPESESSKIFSNLNQTEPFFKFDAKLGMYRFFPQIVRLVFT
jgi:superfamily I DNA and/or RNA helicase